MSKEGWIQFHRGIRALHISDSKGVCRWMYEHTLPCYIGLRCPHEYWDEEGSPLCIHPYTPENCPEDGDFVSMEDASPCPLVKDGSVLEGLLRAYSLDGNIMVDAVDHISLIDERECRREELGITELIVRRALDAFWRMKYGE